MLALYSRRDEVPSRVGQFSKQPVCRLDGDRVAVLSLVAHEGEQKFQRQGVVDFSQKALGCWDVGA